MTQSPPTGASPSDASDNASDNLDLKVQSRIAQLLASQTPIQHQPQLLHLVLDSNPSLIFVKDREGRYLLANQAMADFYGTSVAAMIGNTDADLGCAPQDQDRFLQENRLAIDTQQATFIPEEEVNHPERGAQWLQWYKQPIHLPDQDSYAVLGVGVNITDRKQSELALRESETRLSTLTAVVPVGIFRTDLEGNCQYVNDRWCELAGLNATAALGTGWARAIHPDDREGVVAAWQAAVKAQRPSSLECRFLRPDGQVFWVVAQTEVERDVEGHIQGFVGTLTNISDRKQTEDQLRLTSQRLQEAQHLAHLGNWELDLQQNTLYWSEEIFRIFEVDPQQSQPSCETFLNLIHPDDRPTADAAHRQHLRDRQPYSLVHRMVMADGRIKYVREHCATVFRSDGTPLISRGTAQDITPQQEAEIRRDRAERSLRQVIEGTAAATGEDFFPALVRHIAEALDVRYVSVSQAVPDGFRVLAFFADGELCPSPFLPYDTVPCCRQALQTGSCCHPCQIQVLYPDNPLFTDLKVESYLGIRLCNAAGDPTGNLCIFHDRPLADPDWAETLLSIFAARAGAELERLLTAQALERLNAELEARVAQRTAELAEREALLQDFLDNAHDLIQIVDIATGRFEFVNQAWCHALGYTPTEVTQLNCFDVLAADCHPHCQEMLAHMQAGHLHDLAQIELTFVTKTGQRLVMEGNINCRFTTTADGSQQPISTRGIFRDVTAKKAAEQELQRREARYRGLMEGAADAILLADTQGKILEGNPQAEKLLGYSPEELQQLHFTQLHPAEELETVQRGFTGETIETLVVSKDGTITPVEISSSTFTLDDNTLVQGIFRDISERKLIETALRESQQFLQTVLDTVPLSVFWKDRDSRYLGANARFLADAGLQKEADILGKNDFDMPWAATEADAYRADDRHVIQSGQAKLNIVEPLHRQDGTQRWLETNKLPLRNLAGDIIGILGTYQDITERRNAELALQRQLVAIEAAVNGIAILQNERYLYLNSSHLELFGYQSSQELIGQSWRVLYSPKELERFDQEIWPALYEQMFWRGEVMATRKDGTTFPENLSLTLSADNLLICVCEDISERARLDAERKQAELALRESETRFRRVFESNVVGMMFTDFRGRISDTNDRFLAMLGYTRQEMESGCCLNWADLTPPAYQAQDQAAIAYLQHHDTIQPWETAYRHKDGHLVPVLVGKAILSREQGSCVVVVLDISNLKTAEAELRRTNAELERATRLKDEFLASMSHELRTPLNAILGMTESLQEEIFGVINPKQAKALHTVETSAFHLLALINDILDVAKIEAGQITLERNQVFVDQLCASSMAFIKQQALKKHIHLTTSLPPHLPSLFVDERRIRQALLNLLSNAVKFTPEGGNVTLSVSLLCLNLDPPGQPYLRLAVTDTGIGIAPEDTGKLFQPFVQIDSALNRKYTGTGLGLALVKQIVELHGGQVGLTSEVGVGSCFTLDLPCDPQTVWDFVPQPPPTV
ncbi:MAG: PAS domain S-box protein, partial [Cyanobacteria bacterium]|nr:PAS domain S-box protein [Cyanobacteriota bacterium]